MASLLVQNKRQILSQDSLKNFKNQEIYSPQNNGINSTTSSITLFKKNKGLIEKDGQSYQRALKIQTQTYASQKDVFDFQICKYSKSKRIALLNMLYSFLVGVLSKKVCEKIMKKSPKLAAMVALISSILSYLTCRGLIKTQ